MTKLRGPRARRYLQPVLAILFFAAPVAADVPEYLGRTVRDVRVEVAGVLVTDPSVVQLVATRIGQPLAMEQVRATIDHLVGLGRFEDVRVFAESVGAAKDGVALRWVLVPVERLGRIEIESGPGIDADILRTEISERFGASPPRSRMPDIVRALEEIYAGRGYRRPVIQPTFVPGAVPEAVNAVLSIDPGPRTIIGQVSVRGDSAASQATVLTDLRLDRGRPYDRVEIDARLRELENELRDKGYYEAAAAITADFSDEEHFANVTLAVDRGPLVRVVFAGDPLPENRRNELVPVRQERSVDLDLLEDASRNIENFLRQQGYRTAEAPYVREERAGEMVLTFTVKRGPLHRLASIEVAGNSAISSAQLAPLLALKPGEALVDSRIATVASAVTELYRVRGFARATVKPELTLMPAQKTDQEYRPVAVRLIVTEGQPTTVNSVVFQGAQQIPDARIRPLLALTSDRPFYRPQLDTDRDAIERFYHNEGFRDVRVEAKTDVRDEGRLIDIHWSITEGSQTLVDHILISGNVRTDEDVIRREVTLQPGKPLADDALVESQRKLAALGLFRRVRLVELAHAGIGHRDVLVEVEEAPSTTLQYGGGLEAGRRLRPAEVEGGAAEERIEIAPRGFFQISRRNLWGKNRSVSLLTRVSFRTRDPAVDSDDPTDVGGYGFNEYRVLGTFREPRLFDTQGDVQLTAFIEQAVRTSFNFNRRGVRAEYARQLATRVTVGGRWAMERTRLFDVKIPPEDQLLIDRLFPQVLLSTLTGSILRDSRNDVLDPERGSVLGFDTTLAARALGSEVGFIRSFGQAFAYRRIPGAPRLTFVAGLRVGLAVGFERLVERQDDDGQPVIGEDVEPVFDVVADLPASERFFAGGDSTVRGFVLDRLGTEETLNEDGFPTGGNGLIVANLEMRTAYWKGLGAVGFFDTGNVFRRIGDIQLSELRPTAGFGLRYRSPIGPLRVDLGFNLDRKDLAGGSRERGTVFHLSLGQAF
jgi:outer membrane protein insertion porin family